ncbi:MAG: hypothetical protein WCS54_00995 [Fibrobacteraceae bacterium]
MVPEKNFFFRRALLALFALLWSGCNDSSSSGTVLTEPAEDR